MPALVIDFRKHQEEPTHKSSSEASWPTNVEGNKSPPPPV